MEGASLRGCNFEDPTGTRAHLEGENTVCSSCLTCNKSKFLFS